MEQVLIDLIMERVTGPTLVLLYMVYVIAHYILHPVYMARKDVKELVQSASIALRAGSIGHADVVRELKAINSTLAGYPAQTDDATGTDIA